MRLIRSKDRKVTNSVTPGGQPRIANAFGLPSGKAYSCPGQTSICERICYAGKIEKQYTNVRRVLLHNWQIVSNSTKFELAEMLNEMLAEFRAESEKFAAPKDFRIHWDGDFFSRDYAQAWRIAILANPDIRFWVYTRSFTPELNVTDILEDLPNLTLYLSVDSDNIEYAAEVTALANWAYLADTFDDGRNAIGRGAYACPENGKRLPLITPKGSACIRCGICIDGRGDVLFSVSKK